MEQQEDVTRQRELKHLAQAANERWAAKPSVLDKPRRDNLELGVGDGDVEGTVGVRGKGAKKGVEEEMVQNEKRTEKPWKMKQGNPGEGWQPEAWASRPSRN